MKRARGKKRGAVAVCAVVAGVVRALSSLRDSRHVFATLTQDWRPALNSSPSLRDSTPGTTDYSLLTGLIVLATMLLAWCPRARGLDAGLDVSQYAHTAWKVRDGFTKGAIIAIAQTPDGYLWLGTDSGLYRFDGVRAVPWEPPAGKQLPSNYIRGLLVGRDGTLWIATLKGLASWKNGKLTNYPETAGQILLPLLQDHDGTIWFGTYPPGRLCAIRGGEVQCSGAGSLGDSVTALCEDSKGRLWVLAQTGLWQWKPGPPKRFPLPHGVNANALIEASGGALLLATSAGLKQLVGTRIQDCALPGLRGRVSLNRLFRTGDGSLWVGTNQGLFDLHQGRSDIFGPPDGLSGDVINSIFEDREGNVWVATLNGLDRFREYAVSRISRYQGLSSNDAYAVQATPGGAIWIATPDRLNRWQNGLVTIYGERSGPGQGRRGGEPDLSNNRTAMEIANRGLAGNPRSLGVDDQGRLWVSTSDGVFCLQGDRFIRVPGVAGGSIYGIAADGHGNVWISNGELGLFYWSAGGSVRQIPWSRFGQRPFGALAFPLDGLQGGVWLGFFDGGIEYFKDGQVRTAYTSADGLGNGRVTGLRFGSRGSLWAATEGGLSRIRDGRILTLTRKNGLPCDAVHWSVEDDDHFVWLYMPCGLVRVSRSELDAWVSDPNRKIKLAIFDNSDGVTLVSALGGVGPHVTKSSDGKIWFATTDGVSLIDPRHLPYNKVPPPVHVEQIIADRKTYDVGLGAASEEPASLRGSGQAEGGRYKETQRMRLPALIRDVEIDYTALSLVAPEKVRFRYKLEGRDRDWQDAGNRRQAFYSDLPPRSYRFRVAACNNSGVWNEEGAFLDFAIAPAYYQTNWFRALSVAAFLVLLWALYMLRLRQIRERFNAGLEARVNERTRIARELHDTLLQSFHGVLLRFQAASNLLPKRPEEAKKKLEAAIEQASQAVAEGRGTVQSLRASTVAGNDLAVAIRTLGEELASSCDNPECPEFDVAIEGTPRSLRPIVRDEVYRIAGEAMRNAFRHAQASRIEVELHYDLRELRLSVRDDGKGIESQVVESEGRAGHFGLHGMRERAKIIGANLELWSKVATGTEVELTMPGSHAYDAG